LPCQRFLELKNENKVNTKHEYNQLKHKAYHQK